MKPELKAKFEAAKAEIDRINNGGSWRMTIPVHPLNSDMIFYDALLALANEIEKLEAGPHVVNNTNHYHYNVTHNLPELERQIKQEFISLSMLGETKHEPGKAD